MPKYLNKGEKRGWVWEGYEGLFEIDPDSLFDSTECAIIKDQKKIKVGRIIWNGEELYLKRYNTYSVWTYIEGFIRGSKALRAWKGAMILMEKGIATAQPLAAIEWKRFGLGGVGARRPRPLLNLAAIEWKRFWLGGKSFYITRGVSDSQISVDYYKECLKDKQASLSDKRVFLRSLAELFREIHTKNVYHNDLKDYNILVRKEGDRRRFFLLDLEGVRVYHSIPDNKRIKNLVQLNRTLGRLLSSTDKVAFIRQYTKDGEWKSLSRQV
ncbi:MAG: lipopolysaccharide kinase InaA family protein, partial [Planctomycetota bacterium]